MPALLGAMSATIARMMAKNVANVSDPDSDSETRGAHR